MPAVQSLVTNVLQACPSSGVSHFWTVATETEATSVSSSSEESPLDVIAPLIVYKDPTVPRTPRASRCRLFHKINNTYFKEICQQYVDNQNISTELSQYIESHTRHQIKSILWLNLHNGRITSSQFGSICHRRSTTDNTNIIRQLMGYQKMVGMPRQIGCGIEKESEARQCYIMTKQQCKVVVSVAPSGLILAPEHCYLVATSNGIIMHTQRPSAGVLEI